MGCILGCLDYLGITMSDCWLYGGTGHAFLTNVAPDLHSRGPTAWRADALDGLGRNLGYTSTTVFGSGAAGDIERARETAWSSVRDAIDANYPCYGWKLRTPEFYVVYGYDETGYYYCGLDCETGAGPLPWQELGDSEAGIVEMVCVRPGEAAAPEKTVHDALSFALRHARNPVDWIAPGYRSGPLAFSTWISALETGAASDMGTRYNAGAWLECRRNAARFLAAARTRLSRETTTLLAVAQRHYEAAAANLSGVAHVYPWHCYVERGATLPIDERSRAAVSSLRKALRAETEGLGALSDIVTHLQATA